MNKDKLISNIRKALSSTEQVNLFNSNNDNEDKLLKACSSYLKYFGYKINVPIDYKVYVTNYIELIDCFYKLANSKYPSGLNMYRNTQRDLKIAKNFVNGRMIATGNSREIAIKECAMIIKTFFDNEKEFKLKGNIRFELFSQVKMGWVTEKAIHIMNKQLISKKEDEIEKKRKDIQKEVIDDYDVGFDLDSILNRMDKED